MYLLTTLSRARFCSLATTIGCFVIGCLPTNSNTNSISQTSTDHVTVNAGEATNDTFSLEDNTAIVRVLLDAYIENADTTVTNLRVEPAGIAIRVLDAVVSHLDSHGYYTVSFTLDNSQVNCLGVLGDFDDRPTRYVALDNCSDPSIDFGDRITRDGIARDRTDVIRRQEDRRRREQMCADPSTETEILQVFRCP